MSKKKTPASDSNAPESNTMWGGRFEGGPSAVMQEINASIGFDRRLYRQDIAGSRAHCHMLVAQKIISEADGKAIAAGLDTIEREIADGAFGFDAAL